jgi:hypothetical protein
VYHPQEVDSKNENEALPELQENVINTYGRVSSLWGNEQFHVCRNASDLLTKRNGKDGRHYHRLTRGTVIIDYMVKVGDICSICRRGRLVMDIEKHFSNNSTNNENSNNEQLSQEAITLRCSSDCGYWIMIEAPK